LERGINFFRQHRANLKLATNRKHLLCHTYVISHICNQSQLGSGNIPAPLSSPPIRSMDEVSSGNIR
jgi:hypothetical protein